MNKRYITKALRYSKLILPALAAFALVGCGEDNGTGGAGGGMPPMPVTVVTVVAEDVEIVREYPGRVRGSREVEVRARVGGILEERLYMEGQVVQAGDALFRIESEPYEIELRQAEAELANARADLRQAEREWRRVSGLFEQNAVSERERDAALSGHELAQARLELAEARVSNARLNLDYTIVRAPLTGPTGLETFAEGSLIERGTLLTTIVQNDPVHVRFSLPESDAAIQRTALAAMSDRSRSDRRGVQLVPAGNAAPEVSGEVNFTDSTIDPRTGTVSARAVFPNPEGTIVPGQFVRVRVPLQQLSEVVLIDPVAVGEGPDGPRVFVLRDNNTVEARSVRLGPISQGLQVILEGVGDGERVVVNGHVALRDGVPVAVQPQRGGNQ